MEFMIKFELLDQCDERVAIEVGDDNLVPEASIEKIQWRMLEYGQLLLAGVTEGQIRLGGL